MVEQGELPLLEVDSLAAEPHQTAVRPLPVQRCQRVVVAVVCRHPLLALGEAEIRPYRFDSLLLTLAREEHHQH